METCSLPVRPSSACPFEDGTRLDPELSPIYAHPGTSHFTILDAFIDAAKLACANRLFYHAVAGGQTLFAPTDEAFEQLFVALNRGLEEMLSDPTFLCGIVRYHLTIPCGPTNNATYRRSCSFSPRMISWMVRRSKRFRRPNVDCGVRSERRWNCVKSSLHTNLAGGLRS